MTDNLKDIRDGEYTQHEDRTTEMNQAFDKHADQPEGAKVKDAVEKDPTALGAYRDVEEKANPDATREDLKDIRDGEYTQHENRTVDMNEAFDKVPHAEIGDQAEGGDADSTRFDPTILGPDRK